MQHGRKDTPSTARVIVSHHDGLGIAYAGAGCILVWRQPVTLERFERQRAAVRELALRYPEGIGLFCVIGEHVPPPEAELRKSSIQMIAALGARMRGVVCVIEGQGFRASTTRSVLGGMALLLRGNAPPTRIVSHASEAAKWLPQHGVGASERDLIETHALLNVEMT